MLVLPTIISFCQAYPSHSPVQATASLAVGALRHLLTLPPITAPPDYCCRSYDCASAVSMGGTYLMVIDVSLCVLI